MDRQRHKNVSDMLKDIGADEELQEKVHELSAVRQMSSLLYALRCKAGMTQQEFARKADCAQSVISRIENSEDRKLSIEDIMKYTETLNLQLRVDIVTRGMTVADRFHHHLHGLRESASEILDLSGDDLAMMRKATERVCESADEVCNLLQRSAEQLKTAAEKQGYSISEEEGSLVVDTPDTEEESEAKSTTNAAKQW